MADTLNGNGGLEPFRQLWSKFIDKLQLQNLTPNQTFDLASDFVMCLFALTALAFVDFGPDGYSHKMLLISGTMFFVAWSHYINR